MRSILNSRAYARRPPDSDADIEIPVASPKAGGEVVAFSRPLTALVLAPTLHAGAADAGALDLVRILRGAGHRVLIASNGGRLEDEVTEAGAEFIRLDVADFNPIFIARAALALRRVVRRERCDVIHAHGRAAAWAGLVVSRATGVPLITTWHKGYREQNIFKRLWNSSMVRA
jgi:glycosyltransferase involved in cell wall biosynthesis